MRLALQQGYHRDPDQYAVEEVYAYLTGSYED